MWFGAFFFSIRRTASLLISLREAARKVPNCAQPIILAHPGAGTVDRDVVTTICYKILS